MSSRVKQMSQCSAADGILDFKNAIGLIWVKLFQTVSSPFNVKMNADDLYMEIGAKDVFI